MATASRLDTLEGVLDGLMRRYRGWGPNLGAIFGALAREGIGSYVEFGGRRVLPGFRHLPKSEIGREHRREGFEAGNAVRIFEGTCSGQTGRRSANSR